MAENNIMGMVGAFIGIAVILGVGIQILGNSIQDCTTIPDYSEGQVASVTVTAAGNYTVAPTVSFSGGGGSSAAATVATSATGGGNVQVASVTVTDGGRDYTTAPSVVFATTGSEVTPATATAAISSADSQTGWAGQCVNGNNQTQAAYTLLVIVLIVVAAVAVLSVIKMLG